MTTPIWRSPHIEVVQSTAQAAYGLMTIKVVLATQYGQEVIRPACEKAELFCEIAGTKTLTRRLVEQIKKLGYRVEVIPTQPKEL